MSFFETKASGLALGAEIRGINLAGEIPQAVASALKDAWHKHLVLLVRDRGLGQDTLLTAGDLIGPPQGGGAR